MITQTKDIKDLLVSAGFDRKDVRVRTPRNQYSECHETSITCYAPLNVQLDLVEKVASLGFVVTIWYKQNGQRSYPLYKYNWGKPGKIENYQIMPNGELKFIGYQKIGPA